MSKLQKSNLSIFIDYVPAELRENKVWEIVYYVKDPYTQKLERQRNRVKPLKNTTERRKLAKKLVQKINSLLATGWNPIMNVKGSKEFTSLQDACRIYIKQLTVEVKDGNLAMDTLRTYTSRIKNIEDYISYLGINHMYCFKFDNEFIIKYLDYLRYEKEVSARTRDNYMTFITTLCSWLIQKKYLTNKPTEGIKKINKKENTKFVIPDKDRHIIFEYYKETNVHFLVFCMCCYYCLIRRTELTKIKVSDVNLKNNTLWISSIDSKNNKSAHVTIPPKLGVMLANHVKLAKSTDYLFSDDNYAPGTVICKPNKATSNWTRMRNKLKINKKIKWYYLKDTGITDLIIAGVPLNSVRDQARHYSISQTNEYIPKNMKGADEYISNSGVQFLD